MSKTYSDQVNKSRMLVAGLKKNHERIKNHGISLEELSALEQVLGEAEKLNGEAERLRAEASEAISKANRKLVAIKDKTQELKRIVKQHIDPSQWPEFGVMDKR